MSVEDVLTNDSSPSISGLVDDPEATVVVTVDGQDYTATNNGDGTWTLNDDSLPGLEDGEHVITVTATDNVGNESQDTATLEIDTVAPDAPDIHETNGEVINGTAEANAEVVLSVDSSEIGTVAVNSQGNWSFDPTPDLEDGAVIEAVAIDAAGNISPPDTEVVDTSFVDTTPPAAPVLDATDGTEVSGSAEAGSTVSLTVDGSDVGETVADAFGNWAIDLDPDLDDGDEIIGVATDAAGNVSAPGSVTVDNSGPEVTIDELITQDNTPEITGTVDDPDAVLVLTVDGQGYNAANNGDGTWTVSDNTIAALGEGQTEVTLTATDEQGNTGSVASYIEVDTIAPNAALGDFSTADTTPPLSGTVDDASAIVEVRVDGQAYSATNNGDGTWSLPDNTLAALADGANSISVIATDLAGNSGSSSATVTVDSAAVSVMMNNLMTSDATPTLEGTIDHPDATVTVTVAGVDYAATNNGDGTWTLSDNSVASLPEGESLITVSAENSVGNTDTDTATVTVDTVAPVVVLDNFETQDSTPELSGLVDDQTATVVVTVGGVEYPAMNNGNGTWALADNAIVGLAEGSNSITVTATDALGNSGSDSATVTLDTTTDAVISVDDITTTSDVTPLISGTSSNVAGNISLEIDGQTNEVTPAGDGSWSIEWPTSLTVGSYTAVATGVDSDGLPANDSDDFDVGAVLADVGGLVLNTPPLDNAVESALSLLGINLTITGLADALDNGLLAPLGLGGLLEDILNGTTLTGTATGASQLQVFVVQDDFLTSATDMVVDVTNGGFTIPINDFIELLDGVVDTLSNVSVELALRAVDDNGEVSETAFVTLGNAANLLEQPLQALSDELGALLGESTPVDIDSTEFIPADEDPSVSSSNSAPQFLFAAGGVEEGILIDGSYEDSASSEDLTQLYGFDSSLLEQLASIELNDRTDSTLTLDLDSITRREVEPLHDSNGEIGLAAGKGAAEFNYNEYVELQALNNHSLDDDIANIIV